MYITSFISGAFVGFVCSVVLDLEHLRDVCVQEEKVRYLGRGYVLVLRLATGFSYPLTQSATMGGRRWVPGACGGRH